jgi:prepilin-type N-terminal cleavage/methylation domain-containing protein/prepilin-type processing-associated H-X9-DG protein
MPSAAACRKLPHTCGGFTIIELLVSLAVLSVLAALILPALGAAREAARRMDCTSRLRQIGIALHQYHELHGGLPPGWQPEPSDESAFAWSVALLPLLEQGHVDDLICRHERISSPVHARVRKQSLPIFLCPSDVGAETFSLYPDDAGAITPAAGPLIELPSANYVAVFGTLEADDVPGWQGDGAFLERRSVRFADLSRGLSNTLLVGERTFRKVPSTWLGFDYRGEDAECRIVGNADQGPNRDDADECEFDSRHSGSTNFLWGDGHVQSIADSVDATLYRGWARRMERGF